MLLAVSARGQRSKPSRAETSDNDAGIGGAGQDPSADIGADASQGSVVASRRRIVATLLTIWVVYATVRVFIGNWYYVPQYHYLTPFYSPCVSSECVPEASHFWPLILPDVPSICPYAFAVAAVPAAVPADLLLLPQGLLPVVLAVAAGLRGGRAAREVHRRDPVPADPAEHCTATSSTSRGIISRDQHLRRDRRRSAAPTAASAFGLGNVILRGQRGPAVGLHAVVPLLPAHHRRAAQALLQAPGPLLDVDAGLASSTPGTCSCAWISLGTADAHRLLRHAAWPAAPSPTCRFFG